MDPLLFENFVLHLRKIKYIMKTDEAFSVIILGFLVGCLFIIGLTKRPYENPITPMDVYQGKTTLEYKIVDGQIVDSVVIWKSNK